MMQLVFVMQYGFLPFSTSVCYTALVANTLTKGGGAFDAISLDHVVTMRGLQKDEASAGKDVRPMKSCEQKCYGLWPSLASPHSSPVCSSCSL